jgi:hypothetical protein
MQATMVHRSRFVKQCLCVRSLCSLILSESEFSLDYCTILLKEGIVLVADRLAYGHTDIQMMTGQLLY